MAGADQPIAGAVQPYTGLPLDGGRVLRALVWQVTGNFHRATQTAAFAGQLVAFGFIGVGVLVLLDGNLFNGLWLIFIGWFLQNAAASSYAQSSIQKSMRSVRVGQIMQRDCSWVPGSTSLQRLVEDEILATGRRCFLVADDGRLRGVLTLRDIASVPRGEWDRIPAEKAMVPWERLRKVDSNTELLTALQTMDDANIAQLPVVEGDRILGMLSREQILAYLRTRAELGM